MNENFCQNMEICKCFLPFAIPLKAIDQLTRTKKMEEEMRTRQALIQLKTADPRLEKNTKLAVKMNLEEENTAQQSTSF